MKSTLPCQQGAFTSSNGQRNIINFIREINGFYNDSISYGDTDSLYFTQEHWDALDKARLVEDSSCQSKNDYKSGGIFYGLFLAPLLKYVLTINNYGLIQEHKTF